MQLSRKAYVMLCQVIIRIRVNFTVNFTQGYNTARIEVYVKFTEGSN